MKLYYFPGNASLAPHIVLEEISQPFQLCLVDREAGELQSAEYLKMNPNGRIPVLTDGEFILSESAAICLYLADKFPELNLAPVLGSQERAMLYKWLVYLTNTLQAELMTYFYPERLCDTVEIAIHIKDKAEQRIAGMLAIIEQSLSENSIDGSIAYLVGKNFSIADAFLFMLCRWTRGMKKPAREYPSLAQYLAQMALRPAVIRAFEVEGIGAPYY